MAMKKQTKLPKSLDGKGPINQHKLLAMGKAIPQGKVGKGKGKK